MYTWWFKFKCFTFDVSLDLPEPAIKGLCKLFYLTLHRYKYVQQFSSSCLSQHVAVLQIKFTFTFLFRDAASRRALLSVIEVLVQSQPDAIATNLPSGLLSCGVVSKGVMPGWVTPTFIGLSGVNWPQLWTDGITDEIVYRKSTASAACCALPWTCLIVWTVFPTPDRREGSNWKKLACWLCLVHYLVYYLWINCVENHCVTVSTQFCRDNDIFVHFYGIFAKVCVSPPIRLRFRVCCLQRRWAELQRTLSSLSSNALTDCGRR